MGDVAMLQIAVSRLGELLPGASILVFTESPAALARHCPGVEAVPHTGRLMWSAHDGVLAPLRRLLPWRAWRVVSGMQQRIRHRWPGLYASALRAKERLRGRRARAVDALLHTVRSADLLFICGQGTLTDSFHADLLLDTIDLALQAGVPVAMLGQGIGPVSDAALRRRMREILPRVGLISLREERRGLAHLVAAGVPRDRICSTGDDAVELAYGARSARVGDALGVHVRRAQFALRDDAMLEPIRAVLLRAAAAHRAPLIPLPISQHAVGANDAVTLRQLLAGHDATGDGGAGFDTPAKMIAAAGRCRVVVTGAYHAAVFALGQGIPVVCFGDSDYYLHKFEGLADQFGVGCTVVRVSEPDLEGRLADAIERAWQGSGNLRGPLLAAAERQVALGRATYGRIPALVGVPDATPTQSGELAGRAGATESERRPDPAIATEARS